MWVSDGMRATDRKDGDGDDRGERPVSRWAAWQCPQCGHEEQQLAVAVAVGHRCRRARRIVELVREPERVG
jgi:hypothetical protein